MNNDLLCPLAPTSVSTRLRMTGCTCVRTHFARTFGMSHRSSVFVTKAFLQGEQDSTERHDLPLFMEPPSDPIIQASGGFSAPLYEVTGNCYGLSNAPRVWYKKVDRAVKGASFQQHSFDRCFYTHRGEDGLLDCLMIVHVDDFMASTPRPSISTPSRTSFLGEAPPSSPRPLRASTVAKKSPSMRRTASSTTRSLSVASLRTCTRPSCPNDASVATQASRPMR